jgi:putative hydrolase of the HAD superfamily
LASEIKLFAFDMGHVIIDFEWPTVCDGFCRRANFSGESFAPVLKHLGSLGYETGKINTSIFLAELNKALGTDIDESEFTTLWNATFRENLEMTKVLAKLKDAYKLYLLSNTNENHYNWIQEQYDVARHFEELILSYEVGHAKPDLPIYHEVMTRSGLAPETCLFIDDLEENVRAAREAGMQAVVFTTPQKLHSDLLELGVDLGKIDAVV